VSLFQIANRFSFLILPLLLFVGLAVILRRRRASWPLWAAWGGLLAAFVVFLLLSGQTSTARYETPDNIRQALATAEQPTLVEFFSNY
jgi:protein-S-isoprenylcysteine O-methyltransferase Ste14